MQLTPSLAVSNLTMITPDVTTTIDAYVNAYDPVSTARPQTICLPR